MHIILYSIFKIMHGRYYDTVIHTSSQFSMFWLKLSGVLGGVLDSPLPLSLVSGNVVNISYDMFIIMLEQ